MISPTACGALFSARTTPHPSQNLVEPWWNSWNLTPGPPRTTPEPIWAETPKLSAGGKKKKASQVLGVHFVEPMSRRHNRQVLGAHHTHTKSKTKKMPASEGDTGARLESESERKRAKFLRQDLLERIWREEKKHGRGHCLCV